MTCSGLKMVSFHLGVTPCSAPRTLYMHDVRMLYMSIFCMLLDIYDQCCYQRCVTRIEILVDVLALCIHFFYCVVFDVFFKLAEIEATFWVALQINYVYMHFLTLLAEVLPSFLVSQ